MRRFQSITFKIDSAGAPACQRARGVPYQFFMVLGLQFRAGAERSEAPASGFKNAKLKVCSFQNNIFFKILLRQIFELLTVDTEEYSIP